MTDVTRILASDDLLQHFDTNISESLNVSQYLRITSLDLTCLVSSVHCRSGCVPASWHPDSGREADVLGLWLLCTTGTSVMKDVVNAFHKDGLNGSKYYSI